MVSFRSRRASTECTEKAGFFGSFEVFFFARGVFYTKPVFGRKTAIRDALGRRKRARRVTHGLARAVFSRRTR